MPVRFSDADLGVLFAIGVAVIAWYMYQIASRKRAEVDFIIRQMIVFVLAYGAAAYAMISYGLPPVHGAVISGFVGIGLSNILVKPPKRSRRIRKAIRDQVIARDLTSKGLKWDPAKYAIDHVVPFSRGGDNSVRNLRVIEREKNRKKGAKMPGFSDFIGR